MRILVAEDDATSRLIAKTSLLSLGHECQTVSDGADAWDAFQSHRPDVVISDWVMPGLTGLELCRRIRAASGTYTYFILVTGQDSRAHTLEGMGAGADDYLIKPLNSEDLQARLVAAARVTALHGQLADQKLQLEGLNLELTAISLRDSLTGLGNRMALEEDLHRLDARVSRYGHRYCLAVLDVDEFKAYNDTYGHQAGDDILKTVAGRLKAQVRGGDAIYRYGGEEFLCIFPEQSLTTATVATQRMRGAVEALGIPHTGNLPGVVTLSAGLAILDPGRTRTVAEVLKDADEALYLAKSLGRNRVEAAKQSAQQPAV